jgi:parallel beta-helix repeat protein
MKSLIALLACALSLTSSAKDMWVSPTGDDSASGEASAPWRSLQRAIDRLRAGDTLHLQKGTYLEKVSLPQSGAAGAPITLRAEPGAVLSGKGVDGTHMILIEDQNHIVVQGLEIRDNTRVKDGSGIRLEGSCSDIQILGNRIHEIRGKDAMGITVYGTNAAKPCSNLVIDGNEVFNCDPARSEAITLNGNITDFAVTNNIVHDVNNIGIDFIAGEAWVNGSSKAGARNGVCRGNTVYRCRSTYEDGYAAGIYVDGARDILIENNIVTECDLGIEVGAENKGHTTTGVTVRNNKVFFNDKAGLVFGGYEKAAGRVEGCTFTGNLLVRNDRHKNDHNGELWVQWANGNEITGNTIVGGGNTPLVQVDEGGGANTLKGNRYYCPSGDEAAPFYFKGEDVEGFKSWRLRTGQDRDSAFGPVELSLPRVGS